MFTYLRVTTRLDSPLAYVAYTQKSLDLYLYAFKPTFSAAIWTPK